MSVSTSTAYSSSYCSCSTRSSSHKYPSSINTTIFTLLLLLTWLVMSSSSVVVGEQFNVAPREQVANPAAGQRSQWTPPAVWSPRHRGDRVWDENNLGDITPNDKIQNAIFQKGRIPPEDENNHYVGTSTSSISRRARRSGPALPIQRRSPSTSPKTQLSLPLVSQHAVPEKFTLKEKKDRRRGWRSGRKSSTMGRRKLVIPPKFMLDLYYAYIGAQRALPAAGVVRGFTLLNKATLQKTTGIQGQIRIRRLSFNLSSLPAEEQVTAAELRLHLTGGRERKGRGRRVSDGQFRVCVLLPLGQRPGGMPKSNKGHSTGEDDDHLTLGCHRLGAGRLGWETYNVTEAVVFWRNAPTRHMNQELEVRLETVIDDGDGMELPVSGALRRQVGKGSRKDLSVQRPMRLDIESSRPALQPLLVVYSEELEEDKPEPDIEHDAYSDDDDDGQALPTSAVSVKVERKNGTKLKARHKRPRRSSPPDVGVADGAKIWDSEVDATRRHWGSTINNTHHHSQRPLLTEEVSYNEGIELATGSTREFGGDGDHMNWKSGHASGNSDRPATHSMTSSTVILTGKVKLHRTVLQGGNVRELRDAGLDAVPVTARGKRIVSGSGKSARGRGRRRRLKRGKSSKRRSRRQCRKLPMFVNFADINWHKWVIAPKGYQAFQCSGRCDFPLSDHLTPTKHAIVQSLVHINTPDKATRSCCVPTRLDPISILYVDERNVVTYKYRYQGMMVGECGCR